MQRPLKKISHARILVATILRKVEKNEMALDKAQLMIYGSKVLGQLINDAMREEEFEAMKRELSEIKKQIGLKVA